MSVSQLLSGIASRTREHDARRDARDAVGAVGCSVFELTGLDELLVSRLIAWLLDPRGSHSQGDRFLSAFCRRFQVTPPPTDVRVELESSTDLIERSRRRMDVLVSTRGWALGIENKPVAGFQPRQLADYCDQLERRAPGCWRLVLVKGWEGPVPDGQRTGPVDAAMADGRLVNTDYMALQLWLEECASSSEAPYVSALLADLAGALQRWLSGGTNSERQAIVIDGILADAGQRLAALELLGARDRLLTGLADRFVDDVRAGLDGAFAVMNPPHERVDLLNKAYLDVDVAPGSPFKLSFGFDKGDLRHPYFGLRPRSEGSARGPAFVRLRRRLDDAGVRSRQSWVDWWMWWTWVDRPRFGVPHDDTLAVWRALGDGSLATGLAEVVPRFRVHLSEIGALDWAAFSRPRGAR